ncbi:hypothetical protein JTP67_21325 [Streptomyces sp. S12]|nr:hypothetical protein [Streptomyces sp. S12]
MEPERTDYLIGHFDPQALAAAYQCGHCTSEISARTSDTGTVHVVVHHDDGCPVLTGALTPAADVARAFAHIPDTFKPRPS